MIVFLVLVTSTILFGSPPAPSPQFVPGEVIAKFLPGTDGSAAVTRASAASPPDLSALAPVIEHLQEKTGIPLRAKQIAGGNWIVLSVDTEKLSGQLVNQLSGQQNVAGVRMSPDKPETHVGSSVTIQLIIKFLPGSWESEAVAQKLADASNVRFAQIIRKLEGDIGLPLKGQVNEEAEVLVHVDLRTLTPILAERLKALSDIESAQPNYILTIR